MTAPWPTELDRRLAPHLGGQRWFAGDAPAELSVSVESSKLLWSDDRGRDLWHLLVAVGGERYQLLIGARPSGEVAEFLHGREVALLGSTEEQFFYDAVWDPEMTRRLLEVVSGGAQTAERARAVTAEQSNSSVVYDERLILKIFRHLQRGANPDVEVTTRLFEAGFHQVAEPLLRWSDGADDLAFGQRFLVGATEGWALALTSLREFYSSDSTVPSESGGDFSADVARLGRVTAQMHLTLERVFGRAGTDQARTGWQEMVGRLPGRLETATRAAGRDLAGPARATLERLQHVDDPGPAIRVHGDYHLGQVMRTDMGWFVLDFEGEPARPLEQRLVPASPYKDVTGMLRSFHYAARHALGERASADRPDGSGPALSWEMHNHEAFLDGYLGTAGIEDLLPAADQSAAVMTAYELDKALYEVEYELAHRPEWVGIPLEAVERLVEGGAAG
jgi:maltokinase